MAADAKLVLVVDDEPDTLVFLTTLLEDHGFATVSATNGDEARAAVERRRPDLISLDITMPEKSGVRFYRDMRESEDWKNIPIVIVTGISGDFERFISTRKQVPPPDGFFSKPIDQGRFIQLARELTS
ncbi:MAG: response regulator [Planctomycetota bacterium]